LEIRWLQKPLNKTREKKISKKQQEKIQENKSDKIENKHVVKKGDTLYSISKKFNISVSELVKINDIKNNTISIGQTLKIIK